MSSKPALTLKVALVLLGVVLEGSLSEGKATPVHPGAPLRANTLAQKDSKTQSVEVNGLKLDFLLPEETWVIPKISLPTPIKFGVRITNNKKTAIRLNSSDNLFPLGIRLMKANGDTLETGGGGDGMFYTDQTNPIQYTCMLILPGQSVTFYPPFTQLYQRDKQLFFGGADGVGGVWYYKVPGPGVYQLKFSYGNNKPGERCPGAPGRPVKEFKDLWTGYAEIMPVTIQIVQP